MNQTRRRAYCTIQAMPVCSLDRIQLNARGSFWEFLQQLQPFHLTGDGAAMILHAQKHHSLLKLPNNSDVN